jgi:hypothetical protein
MIREQETTAISGWPALWLLLGVAGFCGYTALHALKAEDWIFGLGFGFFFFVAVACLGGLFVVNPNQARVLQPSGWPACAGPTRS